MTIITKDLAATMYLKCLTGNAIETLAMSLQVSTTKLRTAFNRLSDDDKTRLEAAASKLNTIK